MQIESLEVRTMLSQAVEAPYRDGFIYANTDADHGTELWYRNADGSNAHMIEDTNRGPASSNPRAFQVVGAGDTYFLQTQADGSTKLAYVAYNDYLDRDFFVTNAVFRANDERAVNGYHLARVDAGSEDRLLSIDPSMNEIREIGRVNEASNTIIYRNRMWFASYHFGAVSVSDGVSLVWSKGGNGDYNYTAGAFSITNGWLHFSTSYFGRDAQYHPYSIYHYYYTDGMHGWQEGKVPATAPNYDPPAPPVAPPPPAPVHGSIKNNVLTTRGTSGNDVIRVRAGTNGNFIVITNGAYDIYERADFSSIVIDAGDGADRITFDDPSLVLDARVIGGKGSDFIRTAAGNDRIEAANGNDTIYAGAGNDSLYGDVGNDSLDGGDGNDRIYGGAGDDFIVGGDGTDKLFGEAGRDVFVQAKRIELMDLSSKLDQLLS